MTARTFAFFIVIAGMLLGATGVIIGGKLHHTDLEWIPFALLIGGAAIFSSGLTGYALARGYKPRLESSEWEGDRDSCIQIKARRTWPLKRRTGS